MYNHLFYAKFHINFMQALMQTLQLSVINYTIVWANRVLFQARQVLVEEGPSPQQRAVRIVLHMEEQGGGGGGEGEAGASAAPSCSHTKGRPVTRYDQCSDQLPIGIYQLSTRIASLWPGGEGGGRRAATAADRGQWQPRSLGKEDHLSQGRQYDRHGTEDPQRNHGRCRLEYVFLF